MQFNSETNNDDLYSEARNWCGIAQTDTTTYTTEEFSRDANRALDKVVGKIFRVDGRWEWDDTNYTDISIATTNLISGQFDYTIPVTYLKVFKIRIRKSDGDWKTLIKTDRRNLTDIRANASNDEPVRVDLLGNSYFLDPTPNYSFTAGLEVQFQRGPSYFVPGDTTKAPGFASIFHPLVAWYSALGFCLRNDLDKRADSLKEAILEMNNDLVEHYSKRDANKRVSLSLRKEDYGELGLGGRGATHPDKFNF